MTKLVVDSCAFLPCDQVSECAFGPGQCVQKRFPKPQGKAQGDVLKKGARALAGSKPGLAGKGKKR